MTKGEIGLQRKGKKQTFKDEKGLCEQKRPRRHLRGGVPNAVQKSQLLSNDGFPEGTGFRQA